MSLEKRAVPSSQPFASNDEIENLRARVQALERIDRNSEQQRTDSVAVQRHRWWPWTTFAVLLNFALWLSMVHTVFEADAYHTHRARYLTVNWLIVLIPLVITVLLLVSPFPDSLKSTRASIAAGTPSGRTLNVLNILNALACFTFVVVYLYYSAIPQYNKPVWSTGIDFSVDLPIPAFALLIPNSQANDEHGPPLNLVPSMNGSIVNAIAINGTSTNRYPESAITVRPFRDHWTALVFNSSLLSASDFATLQDRLNIYMNVNCKSSHSNIFRMPYSPLPDNSSAIPNDFIESSSAMTLNFEMFDARLSLETVYDCEIATYPRMPAFAENTFSINAEHITDQYGLVIAPSATKKCGKEYHALLSQQRSSIFHLPLESRVFNPNSHKRNGEL